MKKKLIALLLATATFVSACGAEAEEPDEEDVETIDEEESPKSDEAEDEDDDESDGDGLFGLGDVATTDSNATAVAETQAAGETQAATSDAACETACEPEPLASEDVSVTIERSDVNNNLWVITNTSTTTYHIQPQFDSWGDSIVDSSFAPGEVLYFFATSEDGEITKDSFLFSEATYEMGSDYDTQCAVVSVSYDDSKCADGSDDFTMYGLEDVWEAYKKKIVYEDVEDRHYDSRVIYFRLYDADGNVIYEPDCADDFAEMMGMYCAILEEGIYWDTSIITNWDHAEFYIKTQY